MIPTSSEFLDIMNPAKPNKSYRIGKIQSDYSAGRPKIIFDGETVASAKQYPYLDSYTPTANDRVLLLAIASSFIVVGKII